MAFLTGSINLVNAGTGLIVILLAQDLGARPVDIGLIFSIGGIGGILGSLVGGRVQKRFTFGQAIIALMCASFYLNAVSLVEPDIRRAEMIQSIAASYYGRATSTLQTLI